MLVIASLGLPGCDRQNAQSPQAQAADAQAAPSVTRYRIDRSSAGAPMVEAVGIDQNGDPNPLASFAGRPTVLNLWATWCAPCIEELPTLNALAAAHPDRLNVVALSQDLVAEPGAPTQYLTDRGWSRLTALHDPENTAGLHYGGALPTTIIFAANGREVARVIGPLDWNGPVAAALLREAGLTTTAPG